MFLTSDQAYILDVLRQTRFLRKSQIHRLLRNADRTKEPHQTEAALRQLVYLRKAVPLAGELYQFPSLGPPPKPDPELLEAVDIMLDLGGRVVWAGRERPPYKLCFSLRGRDGPCEFGVAFVPLGREGFILEQLSGRTGYTPLLRLEELGQCERLPLAGPHYYVLPEGPRHRYYKGGEAS